MSLAEIASIEFFPPGGPPAGAAKLGFRFGDKGTHSSRTLMLAELEAVLAAAPAIADRAAYSAAIIDGNCLEKPTASTRRLSSQRLGELYALDPFVALFRVLRGLWSLDPNARPLLAMLAALARDPLFMASAAPVLSQPPDIEIQRAPIREALRRVVGERMNDDTLDKVVRNVSSSWTQAGHLTGRTFKHRQRVSAPPTAVAFAIWLGNAAGFHGEDLLTNGWIAALDCTASSARALAIEAKRLGLIDLRTAGDVVEFELGRLDPGLGRQ
ncbi:hypothetical protein [Anaeromyxobacter dehalogenans]|uniref:Uncharacterized protein n=1 Tax=Anaeromyxobacter dehalogenans (strain 2CP-C) TaxID=290397 RepID=Q2IEJ5_ANADE|nr:hypothetical protein [Anaeromyxobacter dehalogenans]ABC83004.1 hypothetical protein Adeh_3236 [Anaeromyxobacter dehalogenans 2CP-C]